MNLLLKTPSGLGHDVLCADVCETEKSSSSANGKLEIPQKEVYELGRILASKNPPHLSSALTQAIPTQAHTEIGDFSYPSDQQSIASLLQKETHLHKCHLLHDHLIKIGLNHNIFFENMTLNTYGRCGALDDAHFMFLGMPKDNAASWNAMISVYAQHGHDKDALHLFMEMQRQSVELTRVTFMSVLNACDHPAALMEGLMIHACMVEAGYEGNELLGSALVSMYGKCGSIDAASVMFHKLYERNIISWTSMVSAFANHGLGEDAFKVFEGLKEAGMVPSNVTFLGVLCALHDPSKLDMGNIIHACIVKYGLDSDPFLGTALVNMYGKCADLEDAHYVFDNLVNRTVVSWNVLIDAYAQNQEGEKGLQLFWQMQRDGVQPDDATFVSALSACLSLESLAEGKAIHACISGTRYEGHVIVATALVNMYGKCGNLKEACLVFQSMQHRNAVSWNTLIGGYTQNGYGKEPLQLFSRMLEEGVMVNNVTYLNILSACEILSALVECRRFHAGIVGSDFERDAALETSIINVYGKCGDLKEAHVQFDRIKKHNVVSWNVMISAYSQQGYGEEALGIFRTMQQEEARLDQSTIVSALTACASLPISEEGKSIHASAVKMGLDATVDVGTALVNMYGKWGVLDEANSVFIELSVRNVVTWNAIIGAYAQHGCTLEATEYFQKMNDEQVQPDRITFVSILSACSSSFAIVKGRAFHALVVSDGWESELDIGTALVSMYGKCGDFDAAHAAFEKLDEQGVVAWNSMLATYAQHGLGTEAYDIYLRMLDEGPRPDAVTFLSILSACSHAGLMKEGLSCFASMRDDYNIKPKIEHYGCMVDLYGRSGELKEAERFIYRMRLEGHALVWRTLLGACKLHNNLDVGRRAAEFAIDLDLENPAPYVLLSNLLAKNQMWDEVAELRKRMVERGLERSPGCSKIVIGIEEHTFLEGDMTHSESRAIFTELHKLRARIRDEWCEPGTVVFEHDTEEANYEEQMLDIHSELLATAYGLISTPSGMPLHISKNLRTCLDCHAIIKFVSQNYEREVILTDLHHCHHFKSGLCDCGE